MQHRPYADDSPEQDDTETLLPAGLSCPSCERDLTGAPAFERFRVCPDCGRHFGLPARERISLLVDPGGFEETSGELVSLDPVSFHDHLPAADRLAGAQERSVILDAVVTGIAEIGGHEAVLVVLDAAYIGGAIGVLAGEKIALAFELAHARRLPLIAIAAGGGVRTQDGMLAVLQMAKVSTLAARLHRSGIPIISVLTHPTTGGVYAGLANQADIILAEPGAAASGAPAAGQSVSDLLPTAEQLFDVGMIDEIVSRTALRERLSGLMHLLSARGSLHLPVAELPALGPVAPAWETMRIGRHEDRPTGATIAQRLLSTVQLLHGDRISRDDPGLVAGIGRFEGLTVAFIAHERRPARLSDARLGTSAYRKAARIMQLAGRLELPLLAFVDTPGAATGLDAELSGISMAIAQNLALMGHLPAPVIAVITGEAGGAGALANCLGDRILVTEHGLFTLPMVEGALTHPYFLRAKGGLQTDRSNLLLSLNARDAHALGAIDLVIPEPEGGAHLDPDGAIDLIRMAVAESLGEVIASGPRKLADDRLRRARALGLAAPDGDDTARRELRELQSIQHSVSRSIDDLRQDLRDRFEHRRQALPHLSTRLPKRPDLNDLASRFTHLRETVTTAASQARHDLTDDRERKGSSTESAEEDE